MEKSTKYESAVKDAKTIAECLGSISFNEIEDILWDAYGMGGNFTLFLKMTYDRVCHQTGISRHTHVIVQKVDGSLDTLGVKIIMPEEFQNDSFENIGKYSVIIRTKEEQPDMSNIAAGILEAIIRSNLQRVLEPFHSFDIRYKTKVYNLATFVNDHLTEFLLPKGCVPAECSEKGLYKMIRKEHCRYIALLKLYLFNKVHYIYVQYKQICKTKFLIRKLCHNNCQGLNEKDFKWLYNKSYISEIEYASFAFDKIKRVDYIKELIEMFKLPISGWNGSLILTRTSSKHPLSADEKNKLKEIILELGGNGNMWYQSYDENLKEELYLLIVKWFDKK